MSHRFRKPKPAGKKGVLWVGSDPREHNYAKKLLAMADQISVLPGTVRPIIVAHDTWCAVFRGGRCNCDPEIRVQPDPFLN